MAISFLFFVFFETAFARVSIASEKCEQILDLVSEKPQGYFHSYKIPNQMPQLEMKNGIVDSKQLEQRFNDLGFFGSKGDGMFDDGMLLQPAWIMVPDLILSNNELTSTMARLTKNYGIRINAREFLPDKMDLYRGSFHHNLLNISKEQLENPKKFLADLRALEAHLNAGKGLYEFPMWSSEVVSQLSMLAKQAGESIPINIMAHPRDPAFSKAFNEKQIALLQDPMRVHPAKTPQDIEKIYLEVEKNPVFGAPACLKKTYHQFDPTTPVPCWGQAIASTRVAMLRGVENENVKKLWAVGELTEGKSSWDFHVTTAIRGSDGNWYAIDPMFQKPVPVRFWYDEMLGKDSSGSMRLYITDASRWASSSPTRMTPEIQKTTDMNFKGFITDMNEELLKLYRAMNGDKDPAHEIFHFLGETDPTISKMKEKIKANHWDPVANRLFSEIKKLRNGHPYDIGDKAQLQIDMDVILKRLATLNGRIKVNAADFLGCIK